MCQNDVYQLIKKSGNKGITAKELRQQTNIRRNCIQYALRQLTKYGDITMQEEQATITNRTGETQKVRQRRYWT